MTSSHFSVKFNTSVNFFCSCWDTLRMFGTLWGIMTSIMSHCFCQGHELCWFMWIMWAMLFMRNPKLMNHFVFLVQLFLLLYWEHTVVLSYLWISNVYTALIYHRLDAYQDGNAFVPFWYFDCEILHCHVMFKSRRHSWVDFDGLKHMLQVFWSASRTFL